MRFSGGVSGVGDEEIEERGGARSEVGHRALMGYESAINDGGTEVNVCSLETADKLVEAGVVDGIQPVGGEAVQILFGAQQNIEAAVGLIRGAGLVDEVYVVRSVVATLISDVGFTEKGVVILKDDKEVIGMYGATEVFRGRRVKCGTRHTLWELNLVELLGAPDPARVVEEGERREQASAQSLLDLWRAQGARLVLGARPSFRVGDIRAAQRMIKKMGNISANRLAAAVEQGALRNVDSRISPAVLRAIASQKQNVAYLLGHERHIPRMGSGLRCGCTGHDVAFDEEGKWMMSTWGSQFAGLFCDLGSRMVFVYGLNRKIYLVDALRLYCQMMYSLGWVVRVGRTDATSLVGGPQSTFVEACVALQLTVRQAAPEDQRTNPAERAFQTVVHDMLTLLISQNQLSKRHWLLALKAAATMAACTLVDADNPLSPAEMVYGVKPDAEHIGRAAFGQKCWAPRTGTIRLGDTRNELVVMIAPLLTGQKAHMVMREGQTIPCVRSGVVCIDAVTRELTTVEKERLRPTVDEETGRVVDFHSAAERDFSLRRAIEEYNATFESEGTDEEAARREGWSGRVGKGSVVFSGDMEDRRSARLRAPRFEERKVAEVDGMPAGVSGQGAMGGNVVVEAVDVEPEAVSQPHPLEEDGGQSAPETTVDDNVDGAYWSAWTRSWAGLCVTEEAVESAWAAEAMAERAVDVDEEVLRAGVGGDSDCMAHRVMAFAALGDAQLVLRVGESNPAYRLERQTRGRKKQTQLHKVEKNLEQRQLWEAAVRKEVDGGIAAKANRIISRQEAMDGGYEMIRHVMVLDVKRDGERKARLAMYEQRDAEYFGPDELFAPCLGGDVLMFGIAFGQYHGMLMESSDVTRCYRTHNKFDSKHCKHPRKLATMLSSFESPTGVPAIMTFDTLSYGGQDAPKLWHDVSTEALLEHGMSRAWYDSCVFYRWDGDSLLLLFKIVDDFLEVFTADGRGRAMKDGMRRVLREVEGWQLTHQAPVRDFNSLVFQFGLHEGRSTVVLTQPAQVERVRCHFFGDAGVPPVTLISLPPEYSVATSMEDERRVDPKESMTNMGLLSWLRLTMTRSPALSLLAGQCASPSESDIQAQMWFAAYAWTTRNVGLAFFAGPATAHVRSPVSVHGFADAAEGPHLDASGHTGVVFKFGASGHPGGYIFAKSTKEKAPIDDAMPVKEAKALLAAARQAQVFRGLSLEFAGLLGDTAVTEIDVADLGRATPTVLTTSQVLQEIVDGGDSSRPLGHATRNAAAVLMGFRSGVEERLPPTDLFEDNASVVSVTTRPSAKTKGLLRISRVVGTIKSLGEAGAIAVRGVAATEQVANGLTKQIKSPTEYWRGMEGVVGPQAGLDEIKRLVRLRSRGRVVAEEDGVIRPEGNLVAVVTGSAAVVASAMLGGGVDGCGSSGGQYDGLYEGQCEYEWQHHSTSVPRGIMRKMGYMAGSGLGKDEQGEVRSIQTVRRPRGRGLGWSPGYTADERQTLAAARVVLQNTLANANKGATEAVETLIRAGYGHTVEIRRALDAGELAFITGVQQQVRADIAKRSNDKKRPLADMDGSWGRTLEQRAREAAEGQADVSRAAVRFAAASFAGVREEQSAKRQKRLDGLSVRGETAVAVGSAGVEDERTVVGQQKAKRRRRGRDRGGKAPARGLVGGGGT